MKPKVGCKRCGKPRVVVQHFDVCSQCAEIVIKEEQKKYRLLPIPMQEPRSGLNEWEKIAYSRVGSFSERWEGVQLFFEAQNPKNETVDPKSN